MLRRKYLEKKRVHRDGAMNTGGPIASSRNKILRLRHNIRPVVKIMPDFSASKHIHDKKSEILDYQEKIRFGTVSGDDLILQDGTVIRGHNATVCNKTDCECTTTQTIHFTKDLRIRTASEQIAYNRSHCYVADKPTNFKNLAKWAV